MFYPGQIQASGNLNIKSVYISNQSSQHLVSALMVTRGDIDYISRSIGMFVAQTWPHKELIIVTDHPSERMRELINGYSGLISLIEAPPGLCLGDYRNISVARARGQFVCQWDDDDFYHRDRISAMMTVLLEANVDAVFLSRWLMRWESRRLIAVSNSRVWEGSLLARRHAIRVYPSMSRGEDTVMVNNLLRTSIVATADAPHLYCYSVTDRNTWNSRHFEDLFRVANHIISGDDYQRAVESLECFEILREKELPSL